MAESKSKMKPANAWALLRDGKVYELYLSRTNAREILGIFGPGSKHEWRIARVKITEVSP